MNEANETIPADGNRKWLAVYTIVERAAGGQLAAAGNNAFAGSGDKKFWIRIGTAWINRDQSLNVRLDATPTNGTLHIREAQPHEERVRRSPERERAFGG